MLSMPTRYALQFLSFASISLLLPLCAIVSGEKKTHIYIYTLWQSVCVFFVSSPYAQPSIASLWRVTHRCEHIYTLKCALDTRLQQERTKNGGQRRRCYATQSSRGIYYLFTEAQGYCFFFFFIIRAFSCGNTDNFHNHGINAKFTVIQKYIFFQQSQQNLKKTPSNVNHSGRTCIQLRSAQPKYKYSRHKQDYPLAYRIA